MGRSSAAPAARSTTVAVTVGCGKHVLSRALSLCAWSGDAGTVAVAAVTSNVVYVATVRRMVRRMARCTVRCITVASGAETRGTVYSPLQVATVHPDSPDDE